MRQETEVVRKRCEIGIGDMRHKTLRQKTWDRRLDTGDVRQGT